MKKEHLAGLLVLVFTACVPLSTQAELSGMRLTPYVTATIENAPPAAASPSPRPPTPEPTSIPTPFVHVLELGETISTIALRYGFNTADILAINPQITPNALTVGTQILVPALAPAADLAQVIRAPLVLTLSEPRCTPTAEGGLWCLALASNPLEGAVGGVSLTFTLLMDAGEALRSQTVPTLLNILAPGESMPAAAYFSPDVMADSPVRVELASALPLDAATTESVALKLNSIDLRGRSALVSAVLPAWQEEGAGRFWVGLIAYDASGAIVGMRRLEFPVQSENGEQTVRMLVYSSSTDIARVETRAEAVMTNNEVNDGEK